MSRPLVVTDCDEVLLHMVRHFRDWMAERHGVHFDLSGNPFTEEFVLPGRSEPLSYEEKWQFLDAFFDEEMARQTAIEGAVDAVAELQRGADVVVLTNLQDRYNAARAAQLGIELLTLDELLGRADFISVHLPKTPETAGLIDKEALAKTKPGVIIVNAARGGLVDEAALAEAVTSGHVRAAGIDVFGSEPCTDSPLFDLPQVVVTPHLGASTAEAQDRAGTDVAASVRTPARKIFSAAKDRVVMRRKDTARGRGVHAGGGDQDIIIRTRR